MVRLVTIRFSHYCEKARWGLEHGGIAYEERPHLPMFAWLAAWQAAGRRTVPALAGDGVRLGDSTDILRWADGARHDLYPVAHEAEVLALEEQLDAELGPEARRLAYHHALPDAAMFGELLARCAAPPWQMRFAKLMQPIITRTIRRLLSVDEAGVAQSREVVARTFAMVGERLADGRRYLVGDRFTAADLTFAALSTPVICPPAFEQFVLPLSRIPPPFRALIDEHRATPAGRFALRLYEERNASRGRAVSG